ncbi:MAG: hypothetical protein ACTSV0_01965 [Candidatus Freyarchaeota archaeon]
MGLVEKILGSYEVSVNVSWGKPLDFWNGKRFIKRRALNFRDGFPAHFIISESRVFLMSEFTHQLLVGIVVPVIPVTKRKHKALYLELALDKLVKYSFGLVKNSIFFEPHGQLGKTMIEFKGLPGKIKKEIAETLERARALNMKAEDAGILISDRPVKEVFIERMKAINAQRQKTLTTEAKIEQEPTPSTETFTQESTQLETPESETIPLETKQPQEEIGVTESLVMSEETESAKPGESVEGGVGERDSLEEMRLPLREVVCPMCGSKVVENSPCPKCGTIVRAPTQLPTQRAVDSASEAYGIETGDFLVGYQGDEELSLEEKEKLEKIWKSLIPRETICPYCKMRVLTLDRECPHCGAINL